MSFSDVPAPAARSIQSGEAALPCPLASLIAQTAAQDPEAFRRLYDTTAPHLFGIICHLIADRAAAEDVLKDTYLVIWRTASRYAVSDALANVWLSAVAQRCAVIYLRNQLTPRPLNVGNQCKLGTVPINKCLSGTVAAL